MVTGIEQFVSDLSTGVAKNVETGGGIFKHLLWTVTNLSFLSDLSIKLKIKIKLTISYCSFFITIHTVFVFVVSDSSLLVTIQN